MPVIRVGGPAKRAAGWMLLAAMLGGVALWAARLDPQGREAPQGGAAASTLHDSHLHLTNYVQEGTDIHDLLKIMGTKVGRAAVFGLPLQQMWDYNNSGDYSPAYYLQSDSPLYYYSFTDAHIAMAYRSLAPAEQARLDPMITGFHPADMYAADHIKRVLKTFPGVFSGIGEFSIHKEFVSAKIPGKTASLNDRALDRILDFCAETGLLVILHNDIDMPFPKPGQEPWVVPQFRDLLLRHPDTNVIWAHAGVGRIVHPMKDQLGLMEKGLANLKNFYIDLSWTELAKYIVEKPENVAAVADLVNRFPDRFLFGTDEVAPTDQATYLKIYDLYAPLLAKLTPDAREKFLKGNYERLFDEARRKVRAWERANVK